MRAIAIALLLGGLGAAGCSRAHISAGFGKANQETMALQQPPLPRTPPGPPMGLDTQEADVIAATYLRSLAGKAKVEDPEPVLYVAPAQRQQRPTPLAPSVPKE
jgi:hypothetical protein